MGSLADILFQFEVSDSAQERCVHSVSVQNNCVIPSGQSLLDSGHISFTSSSLTWNCAHGACFCFSFVTFLLHCVDPCILLSTFSLCLPTCERRVCHPRRTGRIVVHCIDVMKSVVDVTLMLERQTECVCHRSDPVTCSVLED